MSLYGLILFQELSFEPASVGLKTLAELVSAGKLKPRIDLVESWTKVGEVARMLTERKFLGKAVLRVE